MSLRNIRAAFQKKFENEIVLYLIINNTILKVSFEHRVILILVHHKLSMFKFF